MEILIKENIEITAPKIPWIRDVGTVFIDAGEHAGI
jgi:hypothetical protein